MAPGHRQGKALGYKWECTWGGIPNVAGWKEHRLFKCQLVTLGMFLDLPGPQFSYLARAVRLFGQFGEY